MAMMRGFSLVEVMIVVAIVGIVAAVATPQMSEAVRRQKAVSATERTREVILEARNDARLRRGCAIVEGTTPAPSGRLTVLAVHVDVDCNGVAEQTRAFEVGEVVFQVESAGVFGAAPTPRLTFERLGNLRPGEATAILTHIDSQPWRRFRVLPAIGAVRRETP